MKPIHLIVDADYYIYTAGRMYEEVVYWGQDLLTAISNLSLSKDYIDRAFKDLKEYTGASKFTIALSCPTETNFRTKIFPDYKKDRFLKLRPIGYAAIKEYIKVKYKAIMEPHLEADDIVGLLCTEPQDYETRIAVSNDKDFDTLPIPRINQEHLERGLSYRTEEEANKSLMLQTLMGDKADGFAGCPGMGVITATRLLDKHPKEQWWTEIIKAYQAKGLGIEKVLENLRMAFILRHGHYNWETKEITLWEPLG